MTTASFLLTGGDEARAGGYEVDGQSAKLMGQAFAGKAALAEDASTVFFNPAGLARLREGQFVANVTLLPIDATIHNRGSSTVLGEALVGEQSRDGVATEVVPAFFLSRPAGERAALGLGLTVPYGLGSDYGRTWFGRYFATKNRLEVINVNPAAAFRLSSRWSVGAGLTAQYIDGTLGNMIDFGSLGAGAGLSPQRSDGELRVRANDWAFGYGAGVMFEPRAGTRVGLSYRAGMRHRLRGEAHFSVPPEAIALTAGGLVFANTAAVAPVRTPDLLMASFYHEFSARWAIVGDLSWTNWSRVESLQIDFDNPAQPPVSIPAGWSDTVRLSLGAVFRASSRWKLRMGMAHDPSPVPASTRNPLLPETDRLWFAVGASAEISDSLSLDASFAYLYSDEAAIDLPGTPAGSLRGRTEWNSMGFSAGLTWRFQGTR